MRLHLVSRLATFLALLVILVLDPSGALAGPTGGGSGGGGGGALGRVSSGISSATHSSSSSSSGGQDHRTRDSVEDDHRCFDDEARPIRCPDRRERAAAAGIVATGPAAAAAPNHASAYFYAGAQKVQDSDGSISLELAVRDGRFGITGALSRYFERLPGGGQLSMSMPSLMASVRIDDLGRTAVFLEGGVVHVGTRGDPMADSSITGAIAGMRIEHQLSPRLAILADAQELRFGHDVRARAGRAGVRIGRVQASLRVLDFNVGPPLVGPEVGVRF
ncbi:MAG: hypothetical protein H0T89_25610 [Deltaproteobacteria bacterium]|nr:hypothetical protein [Deltaproteobacteria bacterium]MDQ3299237.1 hypothetical protein [Myxococcota bacterium]